MLDMGKCPFLLTTLVALCFVVIHASDDPNPEPDVTKEPWDSRVRVVEYDGFWRFIERHPLVLMEFYAPWWVVHVQ
jgi:hypothetical protein